MKYSPGTMATFAVTDRDTASASSTVPDTTKIQLVIYPITLGRIKAKKSVERSIMNEKTKQTGICITSLPACFFNLSEPMQINII